MRGSPGRVVVLAVVVWIVAAAFPVEDEEAAIVGVSGSVVVGVERQPEQPFLAPARYEAFEVEERCAERRVVRTRSARFVQSATRDREERERFTLGVSAVRTPSSRRRKAPVGECGESPHTEGGHRVEEWHLQQGVLLGFRKRRQNDCDRQGGVLDASLE